MVVLYEKNNSIVISLDLIRLKELPDSQKPAAVVQQNEKRLPWGPRLITSYSVMISFFLPHQLGRASQNRRAIQLRERERQTSYLVPQMRRQFEKIYSCQIL